MFTLRSSLRRGPQILSVALLFAALLTGCIADETPHGPASRVTTGDAAPDFTVEMLDGSHLTLSRLRGRLVLLTFFCSWCPDCQAELAKVQTDLIDRFADEPFSFLPVSRGEDRRTIETFCAENGYDFPIGLDPDAEIYNLYATRIVPRNYLIGYDGRILAAWEDYDDGEFGRIILKISSALHSSD